MRNGNKSKSIFKYVFCAHDYEEKRIILPTLPLDEEIEIKQQDSPLPSSLSPLQSPPTSTEKSSSVVIIEEKSDEISDFKILNMRRRSESSTQSKSNVKKRHDAIHANSQLKQQM